MYIYILYVIQNICIYLIYYQFIYILHTIIYYQFDILIYEYI